MSLNHICLKKGEDRRVRAGHPWIFSNEINISLTPLKKLTPGEEVFVYAHDQSILGVAYVNPHSLIAARLFSRDPNVRLDRDFFKEKIAMALSLRRKLFDKPFYRLVFSEGDGLPGLVIDRFNTDFVCQINTAGMENKTDAIKDAICSLIPETTSILLRNDSQIREHEGLASYVKTLYGNPPDELMLEENGVKFLFPPIKGQKTGWFYDHRQNRARLAHYVKDQSVLDVFSYLGSFGIHAAHYGAEHVDCIEASSFACDFIKRNAKLNQVEDKVTVICDDAFDAMKNLLQIKKTYDVITIDPPAFVKRLKDRKDGLIAYQRINEMALKLLNPGGILMTCSCSMHVSMDDLIEMMQRVAYRTGSNIQIIERGHQGPDHPMHVAIPETDYLKALTVRKQNI